MGGSVSSWTPSNEGEDLFEDRIREIVGEHFTTEGMQELMTGRPFITDKELFDFIKAREKQAERQVAYNTNTIMLNSIY